MVFSLATEKLAPMVLVPVLKVEEIDLQCQGAEITWCGKCRLGPTKYFESHGVWCGVGMVSVNGHMN